MVYRLSKVLVKLYDYTYAHPSSEIPMFSSPQVYPFWPDFSRWPGPKVGSGVVHNRRQKSRSVDPFPDCSALEKNSYKGSSINDVTQFWIFFKALPPIIMFVLILWLQYRRHKIIDPLHLRPWRHLWTTP